jgi:hypothetical protein
LKVGVRLPVAREIHIVRNLSYFLDVSEALFREWKEALSKRLYQRGVPGTHLKLVLGTDQAFDTKLIELISPRGAVPWAETSGVKEQFRGVTMG